MIYQTTLQHIPETEIFSHCHKNLITHKAYTMLLSIDTLNLAALWNRGDAMSKLLFINIITVLKSKDILWGNMVRFLYLCCFHHAVPAFWNAHCWCASLLFYNRKISVLIQEGITWYWKLYVPLLQNTTNHAPNRTSSTSYIYFHFAPTWMTPCNKFANTRQNCS